MPAGSLSICSCTLTRKSKEGSPGSYPQTSQVPFFPVSALHTRMATRKGTSQATRSPWCHILATFILLYTSRSTIFLNPDLASSIMLSVLRFCDSTSNVFFFCILVDMSTSHVSRVTVHVARTLHASRVVSLLCIAHRFRALHERVAVLCFQTFSDTLLFTAHMFKPS